jgi:hypothetical protein
VIAIVFAIPACFQGGQFLTVVFVIHPAALGVIVTGYGVPMTPVTTYSRQFDYLHQLREETIRNMGKSMFARNLLESINLYNFDHLFFHPSTTAVQRPKLKLELKHLQGRKVLAHNQPELIKSQENTRILLLFNENPRNMCKVYIMRFGCCYKSRNQDVGKYVYDICPLARSQGLDPSECNYYTGIQFPDSSYKCENCMFAGL